MAASSLALLEQSLKRKYSDETFQAFLNLAAPFWSALQEIKSERIEGEGYYWPFNLQSPQNISTPAEDANLPTVKQRTEVQGRIRPGQFISSFEITFMLEAIGTAAGGWNGGEIKRHVKESLDDVTKHINRIYAGTHGTGRLAQVFAGTAASTTFVGKLPIGVRLLRPNMRIAIHDDDTGAGAAETTGVLITKIVQSTRTVTVAVAQTLDADDHIYLEGSYGTTGIPNGIRGLVDDGTNLVTVHNQSRSTYEELKSTVLSAAGVLRDLSEDLLIQMALDIRQASGHSIDCLLMNTGQLFKFLQMVRPERRRNFSGKGTAGHDVGFESEDAINFNYGGKKCPLIVSEDVFPREVYGLTKSQLRRFDVKKLGWVDWGNSMFQQGVNSTGYKTTKQATLAYLGNIGILHPGSCGKVIDLQDPQLCGPSVGGTDT